MANRLFDFGIEGMCTDSKGRTDALDLANRLLLRTVAVAERATGKTVDSLRTPEEVKAALDAIPASFAPDLLFSLWRHRRLKREHLRLVLLDVWRYLDHPSAWPSRTWRAMFRCAGFLSRSAPKPSARLPYTAAARLGGAAVCLGRFAV